MHVAVDGVGNHVGGGWAVLDRTIRAMCEDRRVTRVTVFCSPLELAASPAFEHPKLEWIERGREHHARTARLAWHSVGLDSQADRIKADVVLGLNGVGRTERPRVCVIQQAFSISGALRKVRPRTTAAKLVALRRETARSARTANAVVVQSSWMRQQLWATLELPSVVLPIGLPAAMPAAETVDIRRVASMGPDLWYKHRAVAERAVERAQRRCAAHLHIIDEIAPARARRMLARSGMLLVASDVESFGLPIVEAYASKCPVVLTDLPWSRAIADNAASYFDHKSSVSAGRRVAEIVQQPTLREDLVARGTERLQQLWDLDPYTGLVDLLEDVAQ